jgi:hypothetical protein
MSESHRMWAALELEARTRASRRPRVGLCTLIACATFIVGCAVLL